VGGTIYRYVVDKISVQTDRHGRSSLSLDGYKNLPKHWTVEVNWPCRKFQSLPV
jgi:hypothetical protein